MCGIVGVVAQRDVCDILIEGLRRLEYRGYDSAGVALIDEQGKIRRIRRLGKVSELDEACHVDAPFGHTGIAHTRWATHGEPSELNAHPHVSHGVAVVHNGIIENHEALREKLITKGYPFESATDTEVLAHQLHFELSQCGDLREAMNRLLDIIRGAYAIAVIDENNPETLMAARSGSPLVVGLGIGENYVASDPQALRPVTDRFIFLEEGELVEVTRGEVSIYGHNEAAVDSRAITLDDRHDAVDKGNFKHYMLKEIFEQPDALTRTISGRVGKLVFPEAFGAGAADIFKQVKAVQIVACGSSYYTGLVAKYWFEHYAGLPCQVEIASELRYRSTVVLPGTLMVAISQSGETADTLAAIRAADNKNYLAKLCLCNVPNSTMVRETDLSLMLEAGAEICVASTKAFTNQLADLLMLVATVGSYNELDEAMHAEIAAGLLELPQIVEKTLALDDDIKKMAEQFVEKHHALFLGRGSHYPIALEGALKLKEISYIHAEGYPAGELKHGPLALVDDDMPVVAVAPGDDLIEKLKSNLEEVRARGAELFIFADEHVSIAEQKGVTVLKVPACSAMVSPIVYTIPVQLLAYHVAVLKGTDVDQPRNLAKSVTVE
ncbi:MAG: glutamine--fructose-6-phosphate transaminase (isomerizing) [Pseudomonadales bacterium]|nr:glutamine--fructose-6-phosphate transaminase (isomerizing) [Pseudomonadales bacterium]MBO6596651.1 glutamine--fructose-6-phosphate transaminase (isomerizing) [Pseudomonadales bacterium]MBO6656516.1 glutamine--fructose-6-phosphate transaminase (isomerizing) [Pseudomonadales bacterium]MBO6703321.1 glutamine--fructose-6-phosphate transaminase (isomerizing) [Pseudomonadales bacterium]MBO6823360.1 glutamine--fructose-6-phosphate transaminase (isomerizing) [Pseudomonadales bacterium]